MIELQSVSHRYRSGDQMTQALQALDLKVARGDIVALTGPSGSGKSTLLSIMGCLLAPSQGTVRVMGREISALNDRQRAALRRQHLGFIFQSFHLIPVLTALENVEYPLILTGVDGSERKRRAQRLLERVGLAGQMQKRPGQISGGQNQRVAIARALIGAPDFVLADEPTANLDSHTATQILALMAELNREMSTAFVFSTHDPKVADFARTRYRLEDGALTQ